MKATRSINRLSQLNAMWSINCLSQLNATQSVNRLILSWIHPNTYYHKKVLKKILYKKNSYIKKNSSIKKICLPSISFGNPFCWNRAHPYVLGIHFVEIGPRRRHRVKCLPILSNLYQHYKVHENKPATQRPYLTKCIMCPNPLNGSNNQITWVLHHDL